MNIKQKHESESILDRFLTPEESLIVALIENAVIEATTNNPKIKKHIKKEAKKWLESTTNFPFSFNWCISILQLDNIKKANIIKEVLHFKDIERGSK